MRQTRQYHTECTHSSITIQRCHESCEWRERQRVTREKNESRPPCFQHEWTPKPRLTASGGQPLFPCRPPRCALLCVFFRECGPRGLPGRPPPRTERMRSVCCARSAPAPPLRRVYLLVFHDSMMTCVLCTSVPASQDAEFSRRPGRDSGRHPHRQAAGARVCTLPCLGDLCEVIW